MDTLLLKIRKESPLETIPKGAILLFTENDYMVDASVVVKGLNKDVMGGLYFTPAPAMANMLTKFLSLVMSGEELNAPNPSVLYEDESIELGKNNLVLIVTGVGTAACISIINTTVLPVTHSLRTLGRHSIWEFSNIEGVPTRVHRLIVIDRKKAPKSDTLPLTVDVPNTNFTEYSDLGRFIHGSGITSHCGGDIALDTPIALSEGHRIKYVTSIGLIDAFPEDRSVVVFACLIIKGWQMAVYFKRYTDPYAKSLLSIVLNIGSHEYSFTPTARTDALALFNTLMPNFLPK